MLSVDVATLGTSKFKRSFTERFLFTEASDPAFQEDDALAVEKDENLVVDGDIGVDSVPLELESNAPPDSTSSANTGGPDEVSVEGGTGTDCGVNPDLDDAVEAAAGTGVGS